MNKSAKGFEDAGDAERPARRTKVAKQNRKIPDMKTPGAAPPRERPLAATWVTMRHKSGNAMDSFCTGNEI